MTDNMKRAKEILMNDEDLTCVLCGKDTVITSTERGVKPLLEWLDSDNSFSNLCAADKVVGKAAAFLYVLLGINQVYCNIISEKAAKVFDSFGVTYESGLTVPAIMNRRHDGYCPMETAVDSISQPDMALPAIKKKLSEMQGGRAS